MSLSPSYIFMTEKKMENSAAVGFQSNRMNQISSIGSVFLFGFMQTEHAAFVENVFHKQYTISTHSHSDRENNNSCSKSIQQQ